MYVTYVKNTLEHVLDVWLDMKVIVGSCSLFLVKEYTQTLFLRIVLRKIQISSVTKTGFDIYPVQLDMTSNLNHTFLQTLLEVRLASISIQSAP